MNRRAVLAAFFGFAAARLSSAAAAAPPAAVALTPQDNADLQRIAGYLGSIRTMYAKFRQVASGGGIATGQLWMARPGRMRFEYDPPNQILLLADMFYVYYIDKELVQMSKVGLKSTPAWLLLRDPITFNDLIVTRFERGPNTIRLTVVEKAEPDNGSLTMVFSENPLIDCAHAGGNTDYRQMTGWHWAQLKARIGGARRHRGLGIQTVWDRAPYRIAHHRVKP